MTLSSRRAQGWIRQYVAVMAQPRDAILDPGRHIDPRFIAQPLGRLLRREGCPLREQVELARGGRLLDRALGEE